MSSVGSRSAPFPSLIWIDPRTWMRPTPARAARLLPQRSAIHIRDGFGSSLTARRSMHHGGRRRRGPPSPHSQRPPTRAPAAVAAPVWPPLGRTPCTTLEDRSASCRCWYAPASPILFREIQIWLRSHFSGRFRSHWRAAPTRSHSRCCAPPHALRASASARHRTKPRNPSREIDETHRTQPRSPS